jgi:putative colanic acid biosynthesis glycosyltransferase WcaI
LKFLLLNQTFVPDAASSGQHLADLAAGLAERGHEVTVITSRRAYTGNGTLLTASETWRGVQVFRVDSTGFGRSSLWGRMLDGVSFLALSCLRACRLPKPDVIVTLTSPPLISVLGLFLARLRRSKFVYWVMDLNPDETFAAGWLGARSPVGLVLEWLSRTSLREADRVIALDRFMCHRIVKKGISRLRIALVPPWSHDAEVRFDLEGRERFRRRHALEGKFVVMYSGNHSLCHPLDTVLEAAQMLAGFQEIIFCFIGGGSQFPRIEKAARGINSRAGDKGCGGPRIMCLPYQPLRLLSASLSAADLHLVVMGDPFVGIVHPCKIYNILRVSRPVIYVGPKPSPASEVLEEQVDDLLSACVSHGDVAGLARQIRRIQEASRVTRSSSSEPGARFSCETVLPRLMRELERCGQDR